MKTTFTILLFFTICFVAPQIIVKNANAEFINIGEIGVYSGFRLDQFDWNIDGLNINMQNINVRSELDWEDLKIWQLGGAGKLMLGKGTAAYRPYFRGAINYGWIIDGTFRDSDYNGNDRTLESFRMAGDTDDDNVFDASIGFGLEKEFSRNRVTVGLLGGYTYHEQNLRLTNGMQLIPVNRPAIGLNSTYESKWYGPFAGLDLELRASSRLSLFGFIGYHWFDYEAEADWNLRSDWAHPVSFRHEANNAGGISGTLKGRYLLKNGMVLDLTYDYLAVSADDGIGKIFFINGTADFVKLNEANWRSSAITLGLTYKFK